MKSKLLFSISCLCFALTAGAAPAPGTVRLLSGESYEGKLQLVNNQIVVNGQQTGSTTVDLSNVLDAVFHGEHKAKADALPPGLRLINGTLIAGQVGPLESTSIKVGEISVLANTVAWVVYAPIPRDSIPKPSPGQTGAVLPSGDFFPGTIGGVQDNRVAINSVLFGPQRFTISAKGAKSQISALVMHDIQANAGRYEVIAKDGSTYRVDQIGTDKDGISIRDSIIGEVKIKSDNLFEIHLSNTYYQYLTSVRPLQVTPPNGVDPATALQNQPATDKDPAALLTLANTSVSYTVQQGFNVFSSSVSVPKDAPPGARFTFAVYGDGKFLLSRSSPASPSDNPQRVRVNTTNVRTITLRMEPASPGFPAVSGKWAQPMFLKP